MPKITIEEITSGYNLQKVNDNFQKIAYDLNEKVLYRDNPIDEDNSMRTALDMNGFDILNAGRLMVTDIEVSGVSLGEQLTIAVDAANSAAASAVVATTQATNATNSANSAIASEQAAAQDAIDAGVSASNAANSAAQAEQAVIDAGDASRLEIGTVVAGGSASATITGLPGEQQLNLVLPEGPVGPIGPEGPQGIPGSGLPSGGTPGQVVRKNSLTEGDAVWETLLPVDIGLGNVNNTSDANKPISTLTQTALDTKVNNTGNEMIAGIKTFTSSPVIPALTVGDSTTKAANSQFVTQSINANTDKLFSLSASVSANALTVTLGPKVIDFRNATLTSGIPNTRVLASSIQITIPSGATLGMVNTRAARILVLAIDNSGTVELAVTNQLNGLSLDESGLISTTAISGAATLPTEIYSTTARTNVPYRIVGYFESTLSVAGTWSVVPTKIQSTGGEVKTVPNRKWRDLTGSRAFGTTYINSSPYDRYVEVEITQAGASDIYAQWIIDGYVMGQLAFYAPVSGYRAISFMIIPAGATYSIVTVGSDTISKWSEGY